MMFLQEVNTIAVTKQQYQFKLRAHYGLFTSLLMTQLFALLWSFMGTGQMGTGTEEVSLNISYYTGNIIIVFTMMWAFISGITINSKLSRDGDFAFVTNRLTSNLSNIAFLLTGCVIGGITAMLAGSLLKVIIYFFFGINGIIGSTLQIPVSELVLGVVVTIFYVSLLGALGYLVGAIVQFSKMFVVLLPALFIGALFMEGRMQGEGLLGNLVTYFIQETSSVLLFFKVLVALIILFFTAIIISDRIEVRQ
jgi:hypothetical protein